MISFKEELCNKPPKKETKTALHLHERDKHHTDRSHVGRDQMRDGGKGSDWWRRDRKLYPRLFCFLFQASEATWRIRQHPVLLHPGKEERVKSNSRGKPSRRCCSNWQQMTGEKQVSDEGQQQKRWKYFHRAEKYWLQGSRLCRHEGRLWVGATPSPVFPHTLIYLDSPLVAVQVHI